MCVWVCVCVYGYVYVCKHAHVYMCVNMRMYTDCRSPGHGVALVSRIDKIIGLFCKRAL